MNEYCLTENMLHFKIISCEEKITTNYVIEFSKQLLKNAQSTTKKYFTKMTPHPEAVRIFLIAEHSKSSAFRQKPD